MKRVIVIIIFCYISTAPFSQTIAYYPLVYNVDDLSGNSYNLTNSGAANVRNVNITSGSYYFPASTNRLYSGNITLTSNIITISFFIKTTSPSDPVICIYNTFGSVSSGNAFWQIQRSYATPNNMTVLVGKSGGQIAFTSTNYFLNTDNKITQIVIIIDYANKICYFYKNGELYSTSTTTDTPIAFSSITSILQIGGTFVANRESLSYICEYKLCTCMKSAAMIKTMYMFNKGML